MPNTVIKKYHFVLIHGWGGDRDSLRQLATELETEGSYTAKVTILELPGNGSTPLDKIYDFTSYENWVSTRLPQGADSEIPEIIVVIGHSLGGNLLLRLAAQNKLPENARMVVIAASGLKPKLGRKRQILKIFTWPSRVINPLLRRTHTEGFYNRTARRFFYKFFVGARDYEKVATDPVKKQTFLNLINNHLDPVSLSSINLPTLILWGEKDRITPVWMARELAQNIPNSELHIVPEATHSLPLVHAPETAALIKSFLNQL